MLTYRQIADAERGKNTNIDKMIDVVDDVLEKHTEIEESIDLYCRHLKNAAYFSMFPNYRVEDRQVIYFVYWMLLNDYGLKDIVWDLK